MHALSLASEVAIPVLPQVAGACEMLGLDPLYIANEGKLVPIALVIEAPHHYVQMTTRFGGRRVVDWLSDEPPLRIG